MSYLDERRKFIEDGRPLKEKKKYSIPKISEKRKKKLAAEKELRGGDDTELVKWYKGRMKVMGERCNECGHKIENRVYQFAIMSICHLLPKRKNMCPSVSTHPLNWIALCPDHHNMYDGASWEERELMGCWETVRDRLIHVYESLDESEKRHFPESVLKYIKENSFGN
jgi:hypothetical protein